MNDRRFFLRKAPAIMAAAAVAGGIARAEDGGAKEFVGAWNTVHSLPFPPGSFREFLTLSEGGVLNETNSFLHNGSNLDLSVLGLPSLVNAADGMGYWERLGKGEARATFRKMLFNAERLNFGDLWVTGTLRTDGKNLAADDWRIVVVDTADKIIADLGTATTRGVKLT